MKRIDEATLTTYLDGELSQTERAWLEAELSSSAELQARLARLLHEGELVDQALEVMVPLSLRPSRSLPTLKQPDFAQPARNSSKSPQKSDLLVWESQPLPRQLKTSVQNLNYRWLLFRAVGVSFGLLLLVVGLGLGGRWNMESPKPASQTVQPEVIPQAGGGESRPILFTTFTPKSTRGIYTIMPDGTELKLVRELVSENGPPRLSPDGQRLVFSDGAGNDIYVMNRDGTNLINLTNTPDQAESFPAWSPDGQQIAYTGAESLNLIQSNGANPVRLTAEPAYYGPPIWSPDGQWLAFISNRTGSWDLYVINRACVSLPEGCGPHLVNLTQDDVQEMDPAWSPDSRQIAFAGQEGIVIINVGDRQRLELPYANPDYPFPRQLLWAPDGRRLAFVASRLSPNMSEQVQTLFTIQPDGSNLTALTQGWTGAWFAWSPDGQQIAHSTGILEDSVLYRINIDGSQPTRLTDYNLKGVNYIDWAAPLSKSPSAESPTPQPEATAPGVIYFASSKESSNGLGQTTHFYKINPDGTNLTLLHSVYANEKAGPQFDVSPDGQKIAYYGFAGHDIYVKNLDDSLPVNLTNTPNRQEYSPRWSPDGQHIIYQQNYDNFKRLPNANNISDLYVMNADGANSLNLTNYSQGYEAFAALWSPDGQRLAFSSRRIENFYGNYDVFVMNTDGTNQVNLTESLEDSVFYPEWSPDGQRVAFSAQEVHYVANIGGTGLVYLLAQHPIYDTFANLKWSPKGQSLSLCGSDLNRTDDRALTSACTLFTMNLDGTHLTQVSDDTVDVLTQYAWAPDGQWFAFAGAPRSESGALYVVNSNGTQQTRLTENNIGLIEGIQWWAPAKTH